MSDFRLDNYMERWAALYKGIHHTKEKPRFFRCDDEMNYDEFLQNYMKIADPICGVRTNLEGDMDIRKRLDHPEYVLLFLQRVKANDFLNIADVKYRCKAIAEDFLIKLDTDRQQAERTDRTSPLAMMKLDKVRYDTIGPLTSAPFYGVFVTFESQEYNKKCFTESDYLPDSEADWLNNIK